MGSLVIVEYWLSGQWSLAMVTVGYILAFEEFLDSDEIKDVEIFGRATYVLNDIGW